MGAIVKCRAETPHSYVVDMADGSTRRRNRSHIRPTGENITLHESSDVDTAEPTPSVNEDPPPTSPTTCLQTVAGGVDREASLCRSSRVIKLPDKLNLWTELWLSWFCLQSTGVLGANGTRYPSWLGPRGRLTRMLVAVRIGWEIAPFRERFQGQPGSVKDPCWRSLRSSVGLV